MLNFIIMTISIAGGIILAMIVMLILMLQPGVIKWYSKQTMKMIESMTLFTEDQTKDQ